MLPKKPGAIALVTDHFDPKTEKRLFELSAPLREQGYHVVMAKGRCQSDYTHVNINEALRSQNKVRGIDYIQQQAIGLPAQEKQSLVDKLSQMIKGNNMVLTDIAPVKRPVIKTHSSYYLTFTPAEQQALHVYFGRCEELLLRDNYQAAIQVANAANAVYDVLKDKICEMNHHPQQPTRIQSVGNMSLIKNHILQQQPIGLLDVVSMLKEIAMVKLDSQSKESLSLLASHVLDQNDDQLMRVQAMAFIKEKSALITAWQASSLMPGSGYAFTQSDIAQLSSAAIDRDVFLSFAAIISDAAQDQRRSLGQKHSKKRGGGRSRGGR